LSSFGDEMWVGGCGLSVRHSFCMLHTKNTQKS